MPFYAFFLDIDGTLIDGDFIPPENNAAIVEARAAGHLILLNTGRGYRFIPDRVWQNFSFDGVVCGSGSHVTLGDKLLFHRTVPPDEIMADAAFLMAAGQPFVLECAQRVLIYGTEARHSYWIPLNSPEELMGCYADAGVEKINLPGQVPDTIVSYLKERYSFLQHPAYAEASIRGCDKGCGMAKVMQHLPSDFVSVAIGDSLNDVEMLENARISVAMGNSIRKVKALCTHETAHVREGGVAVAIRAIIAGQHHLRRTLTKL